MKTINLTIEDKKLIELEEKANKYDITVDELIKLAFDDIFDKPEPEIEKAIDRLLKKNHELYRRLAN